MRLALVTLAVCLTVGCGPSATTRQTEVMRDDLSTLRWDSVAPAGSSSTSPAPAPASTYRVRRGDTLWSIARQFGVSVAQLKRANGLSGDAISAGQELVVPAGGRGLAAGRAAPGDAAGTLNWPVPTSRQCGEQEDVLLIYVPEGAEVVAAGSGRVSYVSQRVRGEGMVVMVEHEGGLMTMYGRLGQVDVSGGQFVSRGQRIGQVGPGGPKTGPRLTFRVFREGKAEPAGRYVRR